jgi:hypothetical protein
MSAGSRIVVEVAGDSAGLQAALDKAAAALKDLGGVVGDAAAKATAANDKIVKGNQALGASYSEAAKGAAGAAKEITGSSEAIVTAIESAAADAKVASIELSNQLFDMAAAAKTSSVEIVEAMDVSQAAIAKTGDVAVASGGKSASGFASSSSGIVKAGKLITESLLAIAAGSLYAAAKFQSATTQLHTQAGASLSQVKALQKGMLDMAAAVGQTPDELAGGMYHIVSSLNNMIPAGEKAKTELGILKVAAEGADIGGSNLTQTTYVLSAAMNALGQTTIPQAKQSMATLNAIVGAGDMHMQDLVNAMSTGIIPAAKTFGVSLASMGAAMDVLADKGVPAQQAATKLRMGLTEMGAPTKIAAGILETMGMSATQAISSSKAMTTALQTAGVSTTKIAQDLRQPDGILVALEDLKTHLMDSGLSATGAAAVISRAFGGIRGATVIEELYQSLDKLQKKYTQIGDTAGQFNSDYAKEQDTLSQTFKDAEAGALALLVDLGDDLAPVVKDFVLDLRSLVDWLGQNKTAAEALGVVVASMLGAAISAFVVSKAVAFINILRQMGLAFGAVKTAVMSGVASISASNATLVADQEATEGGIVAANEGIVASADTTAAGVDAAMLASGIGGTLVLLSGAAFLLLTHWKSVMNDMASAVRAMKDDVVATLNGLIQIFNSTIGTITGDIGQIKTAAQSVASAPNLVSLFGAKAADGVTAPQVASDIQQALTASYKQGTTLAQVKQYASQQWLPGVVSQVMKELKASPEFTGGTYNAVVAQGLQEKLYATGAGVGGTGSGGPGGGGTGGGGNATASTFANPTSFATALLKSLGAPVNTNTVAGITAWANAEGPFGTQGAYNPLNITEAYGQPTTGLFAGTQVQDFASPSAGMKALVSFLQANDPGVITALKGGVTPNQLEAAVNAGGWAGSGSYKDSYAPGAWGYGVGSSPGNAGAGNGVQAPATPGTTATSMHFDWQTGKTVMMTAAQYKALEQAWIAKTGGTGGSMPTSPSALANYMSPAQKQMLTTGTQTVSAAATGSVSPTSAIDTMQTLIANARASGSKVLTNDLTKDVQTIITAAAAAIEKSADTQKTPVAAAFAQLQALIKAARANDSTKLAAALTGDIQTVIAAAGTVVTKAASTQRITMTTALSRLATLTAEARADDSSKLVAALTGDVQTVIKNAGTALTTTASTKGPGSVAGIINQLEGLIARARSTNSTTLATDLTKDVQTVIKGAATQITNASTANTGVGAPKLDMSALKKLDALIQQARTTHNSTLVAGLTKDQQTVTKAWSTALEDQMKIPASGATLQEQLKVNLENLGLSPTAKMTVGKKGAVSFGKATAPPQTAITAATDPAYINKQLGAYTTYIKGLGTEKTDLTSQLKQATKDKDTALVDSTKTELKTLGNTLLSAKVNYTGLEQQYKDAIYTAFTTAIQTMDTAFSTVTNNLSTLYTTGEGLSNAGFGISGNDLGTATNVQEAQIGGLTGSALTNALGGIIPQLEAGGGTLSNANAAQWSSVFGGNSTPLGYDLGQVGSGQVTDAATLQGLWTSIDGLISADGSLVTALQANTLALDQQLIQLQQQQMTTLSEKYALSQSQYGVISGFAPTLPAMPHFASGGPVLQTGPAMVHSGEYVVPAGGALTSGGTAAAPNVNVHVHGELAPLLQIIHDQASSPQTTMAISRQLGSRTRQLSGAPGGYR